MLLASRPCGPQRGKVYTARVPAETKVNVREARRRLSALLDRVQSGEEVVIIRRGSAAARLVACPPARAKPLPDLTAFRESLRTSGAPLSRDIVRVRRSARY